ncbi:hypothetical protein BUALT_Bualt05G0025600 [Buddleja alternifolia]|uniref:F-box domain-containing protein n=1 Tax=Buddleja alternifolia TaxID=168488 RepID=A0AAV6XPJ7_9LAMI|nr:hypothetical protein BUALT_Bualt05G0025600 [Buddleja alternifolia]
MASEEAPLDTIFEILTRISSLTTLDTCESVCKSWKNLIHETSFMPLYCQRTRNMSGYFIQDMKQHKYSSMFVSIDQSNGCMGLVPDDMKILASCNNQGILCCLRLQRKRDYRYFACKPATNQWQPLPNPKLRYQTAAVAIMVLSSSPLRYKIVRLSNRGIVGNSVYWQTSYDNVLAFYEPEGTFQKFPFRAEEVLQDKNKKLVEYQGRLGLVCERKEGDTELWITNENPMNCTNWRKKMVMDIESLVKSVTYPSLADFYNDGIAFFFAFYEVAFYNLVNCSLSRVKVDLRFAPEIFKFRSDLEPVNLGKYG